MKIGKVFRTVSNFLFSRANREFLIFLFFLVLAGVFWLMMTLNETYEQEVKIPVRYTNIPKEAVLTSSETDTLRVMVSDRGFSLITYLYSKEIPPIAIDFMRYAGENGMGTISNTELLKMVNSHLPASANALSVKPEHLLFYYNYGEKKRVPVQWQGTVTPDQLYFISGIYYSHDSISIYASPRVLDSIQSVYTEPIKYNNLRDSISFNCRLRRIEGVKMVPDHVTVSFATDILTELSFTEIPIVGINLPEGKMMRTFPAKVSVKFVSGLKKYESITADDFEVVADYNELRSDTSSAYCPIRLRQQPDGLSNVTLSVDKVEYLIEDIE